MPIIIIYCITARECYDVLKSKTHLVGRAGFGADLEISNDTSISRCHADLILDKKVKYYLQIVSMVLGTLNN